MNPRWTLAAVVAFATLSGCSSDSRPAPAPHAAADAGVEAQVEAAVRKHLSRRSDLDLTAMDMTIQKVAVQGETADAVVSFQVKDQPEAAMSMNYRLVRQGGEWVVQPAAAPPAGGEQGLPSGHPPTGGAAPAQELPPGHPPVAQ